LRLGPLTHGAAWAAIEAFLGPEGDRERYYREYPFPDGWLRVVVDYSEEPAWIVTAVVQVNDPRG
jgi:hypothetical protein